MTAALQIDGLHKRLGSRQVLDGFSLQAARGEVVGLLGPNGCGKSTVLNIVCQLLQADAGQVQLMGEPLADLGTKARSRVGLCAQDCALYPDLMNIYADRGNLLFLQRRCEWRGLGRDRTTQTHYYTHGRCGRRRKIASPRGLRRPALLQLSRGPRPRRRSQHWSRRPSWRWLF
jgi:ABC-type uncharacterized transport system ATPase component